jgi:hypothetical protein
MLAGLGLAALPLLSYSTSAEGIDRKDPGLLDRIAHQAPMIGLNQRRGETKCYVNGKDVYFKRNGKMSVTEDILKDGEHPVENGVKCATRTVFVLLDSKKLLVIRKFDQENTGNTDGAQISLGSIIDTWSISGLFNRDFAMSRKAFATDMKVNDDGANFVTEDGVLVSIPTSGDLKLVKTELSARLEQPMIDLWKGFVLVAPSPGRLIVTKRTGDSVDVHYSRVSKDAYLVGFHSEGGREMFGDMEIIKTGETPLDVRTIRVPHMLNGSR